jgi:WD40 repeat protein
MKFTMHQDFVADFAYNPDANVLLSVGGDATLCAYELRNKKASRQSDEQEAELQCIEVIKGGRKVVCGTQDGVIITFSWGRWGDCSDRYPGHPESVDCMLKVDESTLLTGSSDGLVRVVQIQPNTILGVIGDHDTFPVEGMQRSYDGNILCTYAHDEVLRFWDVSMFAEDAEEDGGGKAGDEWTPGGIDDVDESEEAMEVVRAPAAKGKQAKAGGGESGSDMSQEEDGDSSGFETADSDDDSDDSDEGKGPGGKGRPIIKFATASEKFFADL